jgi:hypothetical protein
MRLNIIASDMSKFQTRLPDAAKWGRLISLAQ